VEDGLPRFGNAGIVAPPQPPIAKGQRISTIPTESTASATAFVLRVDAAAAVCPVRGVIRPASVLVRVAAARSCWFSEGGLAAAGAAAGGEAGPLELLAIGTPEAVDADPRSASVTVQISRPDRVLLPGLVNAHTHLDLTHVGPREHDAGRGFLGFIDLVRSLRQTEPRAVAESVTLGALLSVRAGTVLVGDIAGMDASGSSLVPWQVLRASPLAGVSFVEYFGLSEAAATSLPQRMAAVLEAEGKARGQRARLGLQPHAPYSVGATGYAFAFGHAQAGVPVCTHLAETIEEHSFVGTGGGSIGAFLRTLGVFDAGAAARFSGERTPVELVLGELAAMPQREGGGRSPLLVHVADVSDMDLERIVASGCSVAYCPRSAAYFGSAAHFGPHRFEEMLARGVNVCLGTDSIVNLPLGEVEVRGLSVLDEARLLIAQRKIPVMTAVAMATVNGARALGFDPAGFSLEPGPLAGLVAADAHGLLAGLVAEGATGRQDELLLIGQAR
jgi:cytosine/adenosine deaminase-related metal-dependent hydrolase